MTVTSHSVSHHYDLDAEMILAQPFGGGEYQPYVIGVDVAKAVWRVITVGYVVEPQYGLSGKIVREEWDAAQLHSDRAAPLRKFLAAQKHPFS